VVKKSGVWFTFVGEQIGQGREKAKAYLAENPEMATLVRERILEAVAA
jgi:recombination protein RecA